MRRQAGLARAAGVNAFCFYYYNFNGRRILEKPIDAFLADKSVDIGFALMRANENWTRTWDGFDRSVLLAQEYDVEKGPAFLDDVARHFADPRYIRIDGPPAVLHLSPRIDTGRKGAICGLARLLARAARGKSAVLHGAGLRRHRPARGEVAVRPQGLYRDDIRAVSRKKRDALRQRLDLPRDAKIVINVGYADMRKGFDVFLRAARGRRRWLGRPRVLRTTPLTPIKSTRRARSTRKKKTT